MEEAKNNLKVINLKKIIKLLWEKRILLLKAVSIAFVLSCIWILPEPRYYNAEVELAPETVSEISGGSLSSIASTFGINVGGISTSDAIYPMLYPQLFDSPEFIVNLFNIEIETYDGDLRTDYYTYLTKHQKKNLLTKPFKDLKRTIKNWIVPKKKDQIKAGEVSKLNAFRLSEEDFNLVQSVQKKIKCTVDKKTDVTTIVVKDQDRLVCAILADSIRARLQTFITEYRTSKARQDFAYYQDLSDKAKVDYLKASRRYSAFCDAHQNVILQQYISQRDELENDMALKFNAYTAMTTQLEAAKAKVQEKTPAFTVLKAATVPVKPAGPKRMLFVLAMMFLTFFCTSLWICRGQLIDEF